MRFMKLAVVGLVLLAAPGAQARAERALVYRFINGASTNKYDVLQQVALNASVGTRTVTLDTGGLGDGLNKLIVVIDYTYSAATTVTVTPSCSIDNGSTYGVETSTSISTGTGTVSAYSDSYTTGAASKVLRLVYDIAGCTQYKLVFGGASAGGGDLVDVQAAAFVGQ